MTIYSQIRKIADKTVTQYMTDVTVHDRKSAKAMQPGDLAVWSCRSYGSHWINVRLSTDTESHETLESLRNALNYFDAVAAVFGNQDGAKQWYVLERIGESVTPISADEARELFVRDIRSFEAALQRKAA